MTVAERIGGLVRQVAVVGIELVAIVTEAHKIGAHKTGEVVIFGVTKGVELYTLAADKADEFLDEVQGSLSGKPGA